MTQSDWIGKKIGGRYEFKKLLGQGGMGVVYQAIDHKLGNRPVAIKLIKPENTDGKSVNRFKREAEAIAALTHDNIVKVSDFDHDDGTFYIVLEFVSGGKTLRSELEYKRPLSLAEIIKIAVPICDAVSYAHKKGIIHRDIKPENIMITPQGKPVLMDFGLAKILDEGYTVTVDGKPGGTPEYMSPEQIRGDLIDERTDIYAIGIMLFEMAAGRRPFISETRGGYSDQHNKKPVPDLRRIVPNLSPKLISIIEQALQKYPDYRFQTAEEMKTALQAIDPSNRKDPLPAQTGSVISTTQTSEAISSSYLSIPPAQSVETFLPSPPRPRPKQNRFTLLLAITVALIAVLVLLLEIWPGLVSQLCQLPNICQ